MLEYNFGELDNDFITLRSKFYLTHNINLAKNETEKLAELGQINAINSYFGTFNREEQFLNSKIMETIDNLSDEDFNYVFAKSCKYLLREDEKFKELATKIKKLSNDNYNYEIDLSVFLESEELPLLHSKEIEKLKQEIAELNFYKTAKKAIKMAMEKYKITHNALILEREAEMSMFTNVCGQDTFDIIELAKKAFEELSQLYKKNKNDVQIQYALAKNVVLFHSKANKKLHDWANKVLTKLSKRPLSNTLTNYTLEGKYELDKPLQSLKPLK